MYGNRVDASEWTPFRSVIGEIIRSPKGNIVLRIGREHESGWSPTEHVVMTPNETVYFVNEVTDVLRPRSTKDQLTLKLNRETAKSLYNADDEYLQIADEQDAPVLMRMHEQLEAFITTEAS